MEVKGCDQKLVLFRQAQGLSYRELAQILKLSRSTTHRVCKGVNCGISLRAAKQIVASVGADVVSLEEICA